MQCPDPNENRLSRTTEKNVVASKSSNSIFQDDGIDEQKSNCNHLEPATNENGTVYNSEVTSDTEEYFEYVTIDGQEYRRKMIKRTVRENIKMLTTVYAPRMPDGSGPDLTKIQNGKQEILDGTDDLQQPNKPDQPITENSIDPRFRLCKSMFTPFQNNFETLTMNKDINSDNSPIVTHYMYGFGESDFEVPIIDPGLCTQLIDDVNSAWFHTSETNLPNEKSKTISYLEKNRLKNKDGNTVHTFYEMTKSRTARLLSWYNPAKNIRRHISINNIPPLSITEPVDLTSIDQSIPPCDDLFPLTNEENENNNYTSQNSVTTDGSEIRSATSTLEDYKSNDEAIDVVDCAPYRSQSPYSCAYSATDQYSVQPEIKERYSFILEEKNPRQYLIFDDDAKHGECDIAGGPVDALIVHACDGKEPDLLFLGAFLDTYRTFIEPGDLINRLIIRYKFFRSTISKTSSELDTTRQDSGHYSSIDNDPYRMKRTLSTDEDPQKKCIHILSLLLTIIGKLKRDFNEQINDQIQLFEKYLNEMNEGRWVDTIEKAIKTLNESMGKDNEMINILNEISIKQQTLDDCKYPTSRVTILDFGSLELAEQMTLLDWSRYRDVELTEVLNLKDIANCKLPGVIQYAKHFQNVQLWTQSIILDPNKSSSDRDICCLKCLRIIKHLQILNNFSSSIAILLGIQLLPVKKLFSKRIRTKILELDDYMKPTRFIGYKEDLKRATAPCIPFLGLFYQDIVMLNISNPAYLNLDEVASASHYSNWSLNNNQLISTIKDQCGPVINFWRSFKQYLFLKNCNKDQDKIRYSIKPNEKILRFLDNFRYRYEESTIQRLMKQV